MKTTTRAALAAAVTLGGLTAAACTPPQPPPANLPAYAVQVDLAPTIHGCLPTQTNYASIIRNTQISFGWPAGTTMRVDQVDRGFIGNHGGYELLAECAA